MKPSLPSRPDPRDAPAYILSEAAALVGVPTSTLRSWTKGREQPTKSGPRRTPAIIVTPSERYLSFTNLVEAHILAALRNKHSIKLEKIRIAVAFMDRTMKLKHSLACEKFRTDGVDLFIEHLGRIVNVSMNGQETMRACVEQYLERVEYDAVRAVRFFPIYQADRTNLPRTIVVDPLRGFGRPTLVGTSVPIADIAARFRHGDDIEQIAGDLEVTPAEIQEAIRAVCEAA